MACQNSGASLIVSWIMPGASTSASVLSKERRSSSVVCVRATAVGRDTVLAGDPKRIRLLCNTNLITNVPSRGSKEERIRIHLLVWANIRNNGYKR